MIAANVYNIAEGVREFDDLAAAKAAQGTTWVRATDVPREKLEGVADAFGIHPLVIEDVVNNVRPKTEEFDTYTFALVKDVELRPGEQAFADEVADEAIGIVMGADWIVTLATVPVPGIEKVWDAVVRGDERLLQHGPDFTAYRVIDVLVDEYFEVLDRIETSIEDVEEEVLISTDIETLERINAVRRDLLAFRKLAWPMREAVGSFARGNPDQVQEPTEKYFRDVYDHLVQVVDLVETYRDLTTGARDIYLNTLSQSTNEVMKRLTVVATVFLPLTFVAGVYGMNFAESALNMPELEWTFGYPAILIGMLLLGILMLRHFRHQEYL